MRRLRCVLLRQGGTRSSRRVGDRRRPVAAASRRIRQRSSGDRETEASNGVHGARRPPLSGAGRRVLSWRHRDLGRSGRESWGASGAADRRRIWTRPTTRRGPVQQAWTSPSSAERCADAAYKWAVPWPRNTYRGAAARLYQTRWPSGAEVVALPRGCCRWRAGCVSVAGTRAPSFRLDSGLRPAAEPVWRLGRYLPASSDSGRGRPMLKSAPVRHAEPARPGSRPFAVRADVCQLILRPNRAASTAGLTMRPDGRDRQRRPSCCRRIAGEPADSRPRAAAIPAFVVSHLGGAAAAPSVHPPRAGRLGPGKDRRRDWAPDRGPPAVAAGSKRRRTRDCPPPAVSCHAANIAWKVESAVPESRTPSPACATRYSTTVRDRRCELELLLRPSRAGRLRLRLTAPRPLTSCRRSCCARPVAVSRRYGAASHDEVPRADGPTDVIDRHSTTRCRTSGKVSCRSRQNQARVRQGGNALMARPIAKPMMWTLTSPWTRDACPAVDWKAADVTTTPLARRGPRILTSGGRLHIEQRYRRVGEGRELPARRDKIHERAVPRIMRRT